MAGTGVRDGALDCRRPGFPRISPSPPVRGIALLNRIFEQSDSDGEFNSKVIRRTNQNGRFIETIDQAPKIVTNQHIAFKELGWAR